MYIGCYLCSDSFYNEGFLYFYLRLSLFLSKAFLFLSEAILNKDFTKLEYNQVKRTPLKL